MVMGKRIRQELAERITGTAALFGVLEGLVMSFDADPSLEVEVEPNRATFRVGW